MSLEDLTKEELFSRVKELEEKLKRKTKYGLVWEDKSEDVVLECENKYPILKNIKERSIRNDKNGPVNVLIEGDNYHALQILNYTHKGKVDVIYIDPPYNTGNNTWRYNNDYIDKEDSYIHSKWLSFIHNRVKLAKDLLKENGVLIFTIDDYEIFSSGLLLDSIFGEHNRMNVLVVENNPRGRTSNKFLATSHEYYLIYSKNSELTKLSNIPLDEGQVAVFNLKDNISKYRLLPLRKSGADSRHVDRPKQFYPIYVNPKNLKISLDKEFGYIEILPIDNEGNERVWKLGIDNCKKLIESGDIVVKEYKNKYIFSQKDRIKDNRKQKTIWLNSKYDASSHGSMLLTDILGKRKTFDYPKSIHAVVDSLKQIILDNKNAIVLDFFAGSGTTGHAVLELNKEDGGNRQFILCTNNENNICEEVTYERLKRVMNGYKNKKGEKVEGLGGNLDYLRCEFIDKIQHEDNMRLNIAQNAKDTILFKEGILNIEKEEKNIYTIATNIHNGTTAIYQTMDDTYIDKFTKDLQKIPGYKTLYLNPFIDKESFLHLPNINIKEMPNID